MKRVLGPVTYLVQTEGKLCKTHVGQMMMQHNEREDLNVSEWNVSDWDLGTTTVTGTHTATPLVPGHEPEGPERREAKSKKASGPIWICKQVVYELISEKLF